ncbi:putative tRNA N6-adenosine threonylcarbamoyltransferase, mitochondrial [Amphibalanus amphitrite]|uniref:N(6)-L-threonylcarbamoyladenine synthase n=1 Tax=Amphibalanus amphitrite TaxID=1232801 RepID=A0A6A4WPG8_AMPAM|nr:probable tRNA N6-adenosine threonylcarbamoyltransferase, mitochondrial [Amphibalanus amphitrite]XP_043220912.1 probable tRNA N6-adenosine threonylcarbamoyltransferase, mitochondrial [Amphibalanus amphitrite]XP_043220922.1 probable tRNA N6-adenosine threonylcarbamoyltransferase, mitochondrial [Amphibalanus amphitrite]XP_043220926.1 probable tRNA N6-adenosine threonylcarbamoyltransferase, mitochondrial [Amphibalanus amphitrite]XP_043220930.1 probable tRNA N6-adenosine threonylcarbamoyltransfer
MVPGIVPWRAALRSRHLRRRLCTAVRRPLVLGIETSCDDTGCAVVDGAGRVLSDVVHSQLQVHLDHGGIIPPIARDLHAQNIGAAAERALRDAGVSLTELDAVAVTVRPGLSLSLLVGLRHARLLARQASLPLIPVHHMRAHALTVRMAAPEVAFPFLTLLISGGHCLLAVAQAPDRFLLLGASRDDAPGEALDKAARRLKLRNLPECATLAGGRAVELLAARGDPHAFEFPLPLSQYRDCSFSFAGLKFTAQKLAASEEQRHGVVASGVVPTAADLCASLQHAVARHLCHRTQRAMDYCQARGLLPDGARRLVVSGGVACNGYITSCLRRVGEALGFEVHVPPPRLCTDNGVMIAWKGVELLRVGRGGTHDLDSVDIEARSPIGTDVSQDVADMSLKCKWVKLTGPAAQPQ